MTTRDLLARRAAPGAADDRVPAASECTCGEGGAWFVSYGPHHGAACPLYGAED